MSSPEDLLEELIAQGWRMRQDACPKCQVSLGLLDSRGSRLRAAGAAMCPSEPFSHVEAPATLTWHMLVRAMSHMILVPPACINR